MTLMILNPGRPRYIPIFNVITEKKVLKLMVQNLCLKIVID